MQYTYCTRFSILTLGDDMCALPGPCQDQILVVSWPILVLALLVNNDSLKKNTRKKVFMISGLATKKGGREG